MGPIFRNTRFLNQSESNQPINRKEKSNLKWDFLDQTEKVITSSKKKHPFKIGRTTYHDETELTMSKVRKSLDALGSDDEIFEENRVEKTGDFRFHKLNIEDIKTTSNDNTNKMESHRIKNSDFLNKISILNLLNRDVDQEHLQ